MRWQCKLDFSINGNLEPESGESEDQGITRRNSMRRLSRLAAIANDGLAEKMTLSSVVLS
jgi:hypothetical protein